MVTKTMGNNRNSTELKQITFAPIAKEPIILPREDDVEKYKMKFEEVLDPYPDRWKLNFFDKMSVWIGKGAKYAELIFIVITFITKIGGTMATTNDQKTTRVGIIRGIIAAIVSIVTLFFAVDIPAELQTTLVGVVAGLWSIFEIVQGFFTNKPDQIEEGK